MILIKLKFKQTKVNNVKTYYIRRKKNYGESNMNKVE